MKDSYKQIGRFTKYVNEERWKEDCCHIIGDYKNGYEIEYLQMVEDNGSEHWNSFWGFNRPITRKIRDKVQLLLEFLQYQPYYRA